MTSPRHDDAEAAGEPVPSGASGDSEHGPSTTQSQGGGSTGSSGGHGSTTTTTGGGPPTTQPPGAKSQFITFDAWERPLYNGFSEPIGASASSGLPVSYRLVNDPGGCTVVGSQLTVNHRQYVDDHFMRFPLACEIEASQAGAPGILPAAPVTRTVHVLRATLGAPIFTATAQADGTYLLSLTEPTGLATTFFVTNTTCTRPDPDKWIFGGDAGCIVSVAADGDRVGSAYVLGASSTWTKPA
jgi:hypothetical protein